MSDKNWPAWYNSPDGSETEIFASAEEVPAGWTTGAEKAKPKVAKTAEKPKAEKPKEDLDL